jgi:hypothetical protein
VTASTCPQPLRLQSNGMLAYYIGLLKQVLTSFRSGYEAAGFWMLLIAGLVATTYPPVMAWYNALPLPWWGPLAPPSAYFAFLALSHNFERVRAAEAKAVKSAGELQTVRQSVDTMAQQFNRRLMGTSQTNAMFLSGLWVRGHGLRRQIVADEPDESWVFEVLKWQKEVTAFVMKNAPEHLSSLQSAVAARGADFPGFKPNHAQWLLSVTSTLQRVERIEQALRASS